MTQAPEQIFLLNHSESQSQFSFDYRRNCTANTQENLENVKDFSNVCRTCAAVTEFIIPIFDGEGLQNKLAEKIHQHLPIKVSEQDSLPRVVCYQCASTLLAWHELVKCCLQADEALKTKQAVWAAEASVQVKHDEKPGTSDDLTIKEIDDPASQVEFNQECKTIKEIRKVVDFCFHKRKESSSLTYACQECDWKTLYGPAILTDHLHKTHCINMTTRGAVIEFIENNVTIVELLESDEEDQPDIVHDENIETADLLEDSAELSNHKDFVKSTKNTIKCTKAKTNKVHVTEFPCPFCESVFTSPTRLVCHTAQHQEVTINDHFICNICNMTYDGKKDFVQHLMSRHSATTATTGSSKLGAKCRGCGYVAKSPKSLQTHIKQNHDTAEPTKSKNYMKPAPVECPHCNNTFSDKSNLKAHIARQHGDEQWTRWACGHCGKTYRSAQTARLHEETAHAGTMRHVCVTCGEAFVRRAELNVHVRKHTGDKPYACVLCRAAFRARDSLAKHMDAHYDVRKYACARCPKRFRNTSHLKRHVAAMHENHNKKVT